MYWLDPQKTRKIVVVGSRKMVIYNDGDEDKVTTLCKGIDPKTITGVRMDFDQPGIIQHAYRSGDILLPKIDWVESFGLKLNSLSLPFEREKSHPSGFAMLEVLSIFLSVRK